MASQPKTPKMARNSRTGPVQPSAGFWQRPAWMSAVANGFFLLAAALFAWSASAWVQQLPGFALHHLVVVGTTPQITRQQIEDVANSAIKGNFFTVDLASTRAAFLALPWVRNAQVRRVWPDRLELTLEAHQAVAQWPSQDGEPRLVNKFGEIFLIGMEDIATSTTLPVFDGPEGSAPRLLARFDEFAQGLQVISRAPVSVTLSPREAWRVTLDDGVVLDLGRDQPKHPAVERLARFAQAYPVLRTRLQTPFQVVDMRYPNGFALRFGGKPS